jgi:hypothetical protein
MRLMLKLAPGSELDMELQKQALGIADNRVFAGLHYPVDGVAGRLLATSLAEYAVARCVGSRWRPRNFVGDHARLAEVDLDLADSVDDGAQDFYAVDPLLEDAPPIDPVLKEMWGRATAELRSLGFREAGDA